jgi:RNA polymerase sigma-70 factor (ECF subfamily)
MMVETEAVLLTRFTKTGDAQAFAEITRRHAGLVYGTALRILADVDRAADVAQETFLQLTKDAPSVTGSLAGWLHRVATHKAIDQMRRDTSRRRREAEYMAQQPRDVTDWKDLSRCVDEEISKLDEETRGMLVAHFLQGRTTRQIAMAHGVSQATVSRRIDTGVVRLRATLRKRGLMIAAGALSTLLGENAVQAAPPTLMAELGKMALVGGHAATVSAGASALQTLVSGTLTGVTAKAVTVAAVVVIGAGSVVTYRHATRPRPSESTIITRTPASRAPARAPSVSVSPAHAPATTVVASGPSDAARQWADLMGAGRDAAVNVNDQGSALQEPTSQELTAGPPEESGPPVPGVGGMMMGGFAGPPQSTSPENRPPTVVAQGTGGMGIGGSGYAPPIPEPNDSNDRDANEP